MKYPVLAVLLSTTLAGAALAQTAKPANQPPASDHSTMSTMPGMSTADMPPFAKENMSAMEKMHGPMMEAMKAPTAEEAFVRGMIPHHQGAIDMANVALKYSKDEQVKAWAQNVIREQSKEKGEFEVWLKKHGSK